MRADYKNWVPLGMLLGFGAASAALGVGAVAAGKRLFLFGSTLMLGRK